MQRQPYAETGLDPTVGQHRELGLQGVGEILQVRSDERIRSPDQHHEQAEGQPVLPLLATRSDHRPEVRDDLVVLEPKLDLVVGRLDGVRAVADVTADINAEVTADGAGLGGAVVGRRVEGEASVSGGSRRAIEKANWRRSAIEIKQGTERDASARGSRTYRGLVAPMILRPVLTTSLPSQTMHTTGPEHM